MKKNLDRNLDYETLPKRIIIYTGVAILIYKIVTMSYDVRVLLSLYVQSHDCGFIILFSTAITICIGTLLIKKPSILIRKQSSEPQPAFIGNKKYTQIEQAIITSIGLLMLANVLPELLIYELLFDLYIHADIIPDTYGMRYTPPNWIGLSWKNLILLFFGVSFIIFPKWVLKLIAILKHPCKQKVIQKANIETGHMENKKIFLDEDSLFSMVIFILGVSTLVFQTIVLPGNIDEYHGAEEFIVLFFMTVLPVFFAIIMCLSTNRTIKKFLIFYKDAAKKENHLPFYIQQTIVTCFGLYLFIKAIPMIIPGPLKCYYAISFYYANAGDYPMGDLPIFETLYFVVQLVISVFILRYTDSIIGYYNKFRKV